MWLFEEEKKLFVLLFHPSSMSFSQILPLLFLSKAFFLLLQVGFSHSNILRTIIQHACLRFPSLGSYSNALDTLSRKSARHTESSQKRSAVQKVFVIFGGDTSERQVSLMSGTNVWLNLQAFDDVSMKFLWIILIILFLSWWFWYSIHKKNFNWMGTDGNRKLGSTSWRILS